MKALTIYRFIGNSVHFQLECVCVVFAMLKEVSAADCNNNFHGYALDQWYQRILFKRVGSTFSYDHWLLCLQNVFLIAKYLVLA